MGFDLGDTLGGMAQAYRGFQQGAREAKADNMQDQVDAVQTQKLDAQSQLIPGQTAVAKLAQQNDTTRAQGEAKLLPGQIDMAQQDQARALRQQTDKDVQAAVQTAATAQAAQDAIGGMMGKAIATNDPVSLTRLLDHAVDIPEVFPQLNGMGRVKDAQLVDAPAGAVAADGKPITGKAIQTTFADGSTKYLRTDGPLAAYQKQVQADNFKNAKVVGEGGALIGAQGTIGYGAPKPEAPAVQVERMRQNSGAGIYANGGAGTKNGKAPATPADQALSLLDANFKSNGKDTAPAAREAAQSYISNIMSPQNPQLPPSMVSRIAYEAATDPTKTSVQINPQTGNPAKIYRNPEINGGQPILIADGVGSVADMETAMKGKAPMVKAVGEMMAAQTPAVQSMITDYASGGDAAKAVEAKLAGLPDAQRATALASIQRKAALLGQYAQPGQAKPAAAAAPAAPARTPGRGLGGMLDSGYTPPPDSPAGRRQAAQAKSATQALADKTAKSAATAEAQRMASSQFQNDLSAAGNDQAKLLDVARKYDGQRASLPQGDLTTLNQIMSKI